MPPSVSLVTVSAKNSRVYRRKFDHEQAQVRHAAGETVASLAREYGVNWMAVKRVAAEWRRASTWAAVYAWPVRAA